MNQKEWQRAYEPVSAHLEGRVQTALAQIDEKSPARRIPLRTAAIVMALVLALAGVAYAVFSSQLAGLFGWLYDEDWKNEMLAGDIDAMAKMLRLGDVVYTVEEMIYKTEGDYNGLYGLIRITPAEGSNITLIPQDYGIDEPAGYSVHYGVEEDIPDDAPSYVELAKERGGKIIFARTSIESVYQNGVLCDAPMGEWWIAQPDGSILGGLEIPLERADQYELTLWVTNWEVTYEGEWLREEPENTWLQDTWTITVTPERKGE